MEISLYDRPGRRRNVCFILHSVFAGFRNTYYDYGVCSRSCQQESPVQAYYQLEKPGTKWHIHGYVALIGNYLLMMFYTTVSGWMLYYFYLTATGKFVGLDADGVGNVFNEMLSQPGIMALWYDNCCGSWNFYMFHRSSKRS